MGVQGLTSYVNSRSDVYFKEHHLANSLLVIDGYALTASLYNSSHKLNSAFGGDYDKYLKIVLKFFDVLKICGVTPIVICDGGYEKRKFQTLRNRTVSKISSLSRVTPCNYRTSCFPLLMKHVFVEALLERGVTLVQSDFEADSEVATLARKLDAPVLSNDSDFFIFDVAYIPITSMDLSRYETNNRGQHYVPCKIYHVDNLLKGFGGLPKTMLPLIATLLGNDYIRPSQFSNFYSNLKMDKSKKTKPGMRRVKGIISWLQNETFDSAVEKVLKTTKKAARSYVRKNIKTIIKGYTNLSTPLEKYLPPNIQAKYKNSDSLNAIAAEFSKLTFSEDINDGPDSEDIAEEPEDIATEDESECSNEGSYSNDDLSDCEMSSGEGCESDHSVVALKPGTSSQTSLPPWILEESRKGNLSRTINTLISLRLYLFDPQVEDYSLPHAGQIGIPILQTIMGLLEIDSIKYWCRVKSSYSSNQLESVPSCIFDPKVPLCELSEPLRKKIVLETLKLDSGNSLEYFPREWQLYIMSVVYWVKSASDVNVRPHHLHALIITLIVVGVINKKIGIFWQRKSFLKRYGRMLGDRSFVNKPRFSNNTNIQKIIDAISIYECVGAMDSVINYFHVDDHLRRRPQNFSRQAVHLFAQFQYCFQFAATLNSLLLMPFKRCHLGMFYNGTFLYNFTCNFSKHSNIISYIENLFSKQPTIVFLYKTIFEKISNLTSVIPKQKLRAKKRTKRKTPANKITFSSNVEEVSKEEYSDVNNKFSLLGIHN